jgi:hypothetical protein
MANEEYMEIYLNFPVLPDGSIKNLALPETVA